MKLSRSFVLYRLIPSFGRIRTYREVTHIIEMELETSRKTDGALHLKQRYGGWSIMNSYSSMIGRFGNLIDPSCSFQLTPQLAKICRSDHRLSQYRAYIAVPQLDLCNFVPRLSNGAMLAANSWHIHNMPSKPQLKYHLKYGFSLFNCIDALDHSIP